MLLKSILKSRYLRGVAIKRITTKVNFVKKSSKKLAIVSVKKEPQHAKYQLLHELSHLRFRHIKYTKNNDLINLYEDFIINRALPAAIRAKAKKIRKHTKKCNIFDINDMNIVLWGQLTTNMIKVLSMLTPKACRKIMCKNTSSIKFMIVLAHNILNDEMKRILEAYLDYYKQYIQEALGQK